MYKILINYRGVLTDEKSQLLACPRKDALEIASSLKYDHHIEFIFYDELFKVISPKGFDLSKNYIAVSIGLESLYEQYDLIILRAMPSSYLDPDIKGKIYVVDPKIGLTIQDKETIIKILEQKTQK